MQNEGYGECDRGREIQMSAQPFIILAPDMESMPTSKAIEDEADYRRA
jgi:hypothetical protein